MKGGGGVGDEEVGVEEEVQDRKSVQTARRGKGKEESRSGKVI